VGRTQGLLSLSASICSWAWKPTWDRGQGLGTPWRPPLRSPSSCTCTLKHLALGWGWVWVPCLCLASAELTPSLRRRPLPPLTHSPPNGFTHHATSQPSLLPPWPQRSRAEPRGARAAGGSGDAAPAQRPLNLPVNLPGTPVGPIWAPATLGLDSHPGVLGKLPVSACRVGGNLQGRTRTVTPGTPAGLAREAAGACKAGGRGKQSGASGRARDPLPDPAALGQPPGVAQGAPGAPEGPFWYTGVR